MRGFFTKLTMSLLVVFVSVLSIAAQKTVSGTVTDASNSEALIGANVLVKGTTNGTITDIDGNYSLRVSEGDVLVFSYTGYTDQEISVGANSTINVALVSGKLLDEVVVVGYGTQKEKEITSAVVSVSNDEFNRGPISDPVQLLQGKVAGLQVYNRGGDPNRPSTIRLRGLSTVGANVEPLIVIDGIIGASLQNVDPNDIQTVDVLKDGSAAAIYGSRGSSGVIIITTKKGKAGKGVELSYNGQAALSSKTRTIKNMTGDEFVAAGGTDLGSRTDWLSAVTRQGFSQVHGVSAQGGSGSTTYRISGNFRDTEGIVKGTGFEQFNTRLNLSTMGFNDKLKIDFNTSFTNKDQDYGFQEALRYAVIYNPTAPIYGKDSKFDFNEDQFGSYFETLGLFDSFNPVSIVEQNRNFGKRKEFNYGVNFGYTLLDNLTLNLRVGKQNNTLANKSYYPTTSLFRGNATSPQRKGRADFYNEETSFKLLESFATYVASLGSSSNLTLTGGYSFQQNNYNGNSLSLGDFPDNSINYLDRIEASQDILNAGFIYANSDASPDEKIIAFFGRANLTFDDGIFVNASLRREGSTKLGEGKKWGLFPSIGAGIDLSKYLLNSFDELKLRVGYGVTGALPGQSGLSQEIRNIVNAADGGVTTVLARAGNPDLKWEEKGEINVGLDFSKGRISGSIDLYDRNIKDFILNRVIEATGGTTNQWANSGTLNTKGAELAINYDLIKGDNTNYTTGLVLSTYNSVLKDYAVEREMRANLGAPGQNSTAVILVKEGEEIGQIWGPVFDGVAENGAPILKDVNGDGQLVTGQDKALDPNVDFQVLGKGIPDLELGWSNNLEISGWNINAFFRGAFGHSLVNSFRAFYEPQISTQSSYNFMNTSLAVDGLTAARFSSLYVEKADFFKLDNLTISRKIGLGDFKGISNLNVSLTGQNLFVLTKYTGADPEPSLVDYGDPDNGGSINANPDVLSPGLDRRLNYFSARTITFGVNFNF